MSLLSETRENLHRWTVLLLIVMLSSALWAQPPSNDVEADPLFEAVTGLLQKLPRTVMPEDESSRPDEFFRWLNRHDLEMSLPGAKILMSDQEREQLLDELKADPDGLRRLGVLLPRRAEVLEWARQQYESTDSMPNWLVANSPELRPVLVERAAKGHEVCLRALVLVDWELAEPLLREMSKGEHHLKALAALRYHPSAAPKSRRGLLRVYRDGQSGKYEREHAAELLLSYEWEGREEFFEEVLQDPGWVKQFSAPIGDFVVANPEWLPRLVQRLGDPRSVQHNNAVLGIVALAEHDPKPENLKPLLPWIQDSKWALVKRHERDSFIEALGKADIPEAVPGLLELIEASETPAELYGIFTALERYQPQRLEAAWRKAKPGFHDSGLVNGYHSGLVEVGIRNGWVTLDEQVEAIRLYCSEKGRPPDWEGDSSGKYPFERLVATTCVYGGAERALLERLIELAGLWQRSRRPELKKLEKVLFRYPAPEVTSYLIRRVGQGGVSTELLLELFSRRESLEDDHLEALGSLANARGAKAGLARAFLEQLEADEAMLRGDPAQALALLAAARYLGQPLPSDWLRAAAALPEFESSVLSYLEVSETESSRTLLKELHKGYTITGRHSFLSRLRKIERSLVRRYQEEGRVGDLYVLLDDHEGHSLIRGNTELRVEGGVGELTFQTRIQPSEEHPCYDRRELSAKELRSFQEFMSQRSVDTWGEWRNPTSHHSTVYQFLHLSPDGGHRISIEYNGGTDQGVGNKYLELVEMFERMKDEPAQTTYEFMGDIPQARVIEDHIPADTVLADEEGLKVRLLDDKRVHYWRMLGPDGVGGPVRIQPPLPSEPHHNGSYFVSLPDQTRLIVGLERMTRAKKGGRERLFLKGRFGIPVLESSGKRAIVAQAEGVHFGEPNTIKLLDINNATLHDVDLADADTLFPVAYLRTRQKFLVARSEAEEFSATASDWYLVDPWTGEATQVEGEFRPWLGVGERGLQHAGGSRFWATMKSGLGTEVGLIDEETFRFEVKAHYPGLHFRSSQMWVQDGVVYVTIGDIVKVPLGQQ